MDRFVELNAQLLSQLECPVCFETCVPPIYMCCNGHSVCAKCQPQLNECSTCRAPGKPTARSVQLEKIAALLESSCPNQENGCKLTFNIEELAKHLPKCDHGFECHLCKKWKGSVECLKEHVVKAHGSYFFEVDESGEIHMGTRTPARKELHDRTTFNMFAYNVDIFWLESKYDSGTRIFSRTLRIVSHDAEDALRYYYSMEFSKNNHKVFHQTDVLPEGATPGNMDIVIPTGIIDAIDDGWINCILKISQTITTD